MTTVQQETRIPTGTWQADRLHSSIEFAVKHMGVSAFRGQVEDFDATLEVDEAGAVLSGGGRPASIQTGEEALDAHLQSPEFFDSERYPEVSFVSSRFVPEAGELVLAGELTIKDTTHPVELRARITEPTADPSGKLRAGLELQTIIDRTQYGMNWNAELPSGGAVLANDVTLTAHVELVQE